MTPVDRTGATMRHSRRPASFAIATIVALVAAVLAVVATPVTASSVVVQQCRVTYNAPQGGAIRPKDPDKHSLSAFNIAVDDPRIVADIDVSVDLQHPDVKDLQIYMLTSATEGLLPTVHAVNGNLVSGPVNGLYTFDDEAPNGATLATGSSPGVYRPHGAATHAEGAPGNARGWSLWILNYGELQGVVRSARVTITYATCDSDGDGIDDSVDNCRYEPNADQRNSDDDSVGDACDIDDDNDGVDDVSDPCPTVAAPGGCPTVSREAKIAHKKKARKVVVTLQAGLPACRTGKVVLWRVRKGRSDARSGSGRANARGKVELKAPRKPGKYYATSSARLISGVAVCGQATSRRIAVKR